MKQTRREFIAKTGCALSMVSLATQVEHFGLMSAMAQKTEDTNENVVPSDYRALVLVFMQGGNDGNNMVIPNHSDASVSNYAAYTAARGTQGLALAQNTLLPIAVPRMGNLTYGLNPSFGPLPMGPTFPNNINNGIHDLWGLGKMAIVPNVGTLFAPMTRTQYQNGTIKRPFQLFSHSDQVSQYQAGRSDVQSFTGWGGRTSDRRTTPDNPGGLIPMITSISGSQLFTAGQTTLPLAMGAAPAGLNTVLAMNGFGTSASELARRAAFDGLRTQDLNQNLVAAASHITNQSVSANAALATFQEVTVPFPATSIGNQLKQVARLIKKRTDLSVNRQIFYVQIGSFDTHTVQLNQQTNLLGQMSQAIRSFYDEMTTQGLSDKVTTFTMSDFSRTFNPAGTGTATVGSDHAWGNHMMVIGGAVTNSDFYGVNTGNGTPFPTLVQNGPDDADSGTAARGRWIPTTSIEQYAGTIAKWFGVTATDLPIVFPNIGNFPTNRDLGFLGAP
jgi:uncharacterized protein (DUF1501 family)